MSASYLKERLHDELTTKSFIHPLRLTDILVSNLCMCVCVCVCVCVCACVRAYLSI